MAKLKAYLSFVLPFAFLLSSHVMAHELRETSLGKSIQFDNAEVHELGESKRNWIPLASRKIVIETGTDDYTHPASYNPSNSRAIETLDGIIWRSDTNTDSSPITRRDKYYKGEIGRGSGIENQPPCNYERGMLIGNELNLLCDYEDGHLDHHQIKFEGENQHPYSYEGFTHWPHQDPADFDTEDGNTYLPIRFKGEPMNYKDASVMKHHNTGRLSKFDHAAFHMSQAKITGMKNGDKTHYGGVPIMEDVGEKTKN